MSPKWQIRKKSKNQRPGNGKTTNNKEIERKFQEWVELRKLKNDHFDQGIAITMETKLKLGYILVIFMLLYSSYAIYFIVHCI